jgi:hypothetical protein
MSGTKCRSRSLMARCAVFVILASASACGPESGVGQNGQYVFVADAPVVDSTPYPLRALLLVEQDDDLGLALVYLFTGQLGDAGLGLPDLRRVARQFGRFQMAFDAPRQSYTSTRLFSTPAFQLTLADGSSRALRVLDDAALQVTGAARYLAYSETDDFDVDAHHAPLEFTGDLPAFSVDLQPAPLQVPAPPPAVELRLEVGEENITLNYGEPSADYLVIELLQVVHRRQQPNTAIEALLRVSLPTGAPYGLGRSLLASAASQGCWSAQRPLQLRVTQIVRAYHPASEGDRALIQQRSASFVVHPAQWAPLAGEYTKPAYCEAFD